MDTIVTGADLYARLRRVGNVLLGYDEAHLVPAARRLAKADGLRVQQYRERINRTMSPHQIRTRAITVSLTTETDLTTLVFPDATPR